MPSWRLQGRFARGLQASPKSCQVNTSRANRGRRPAAEDAGAQNLTNSLPGRESSILAILMIESFALIKAGVSGVPVAVRPAFRALGLRLLRDTAGCQDGLDVEMATCTVTR